MNIVLIGFMGAGKTTVGKAVSKQSHFTFVDIDELILKETKSDNMHEIFAEKGETFLRKMETMIAKKYVSQDNLVISTGGGIVLNREILNDFRMSNGKVIFLNASFEEITRRLKNDQTRPLFQDFISAKKLYDFRLPLYFQYADEIIDVDNRSIDEIANMITIPYGI